MANEQNVYRIYQRQVFRFGIILGTLYLFLRLSHNLLIQADQGILAINVGAVTVLGLLYLLHKKYFQLATSIFFLICLVLMGSVWNNYGGWNGPVPYTIMVLLIFICISTRGWVTPFLLICYGLSIPFFKQFSAFPVNPNYSSLSLSFDFLVNSILLIAITLFLKQKFNRNKVAIEMASKQIQDSKEELLLQSNLLLSQQKEIVDLKKQRKRLLDVKKVEVKEAADQLAHYRFMNSHILRSPITKILGVVDLIKLNHPDDPEMEQLNQIMGKAQDMDQEIRKLANIASQSANSG